MDFFRTDTDLTVFLGWWGGIFVGLYTLFQLWLAGKALGVSTGMGNICHIAGSKLPYFNQGDFKSWNTWRLWFLVGLPLGGFIAFATSTGDAVGLSNWAFHFDMGTYYNAMFATVFGGSTIVKAIVLILGGIAIGYGARLAGGCTSGHSIAGIAVMNPPSLLATVGFLVGGIVTVQLIFNVIM